MLHNFTQVVVAFTVILCMFVSVQDLFMKSMTIERRDYFLWVFITIAYILTFVDGYQYVVCVFRDF